MFEAKIGITYVPSSKPEVDKNKQKLYKEAQMSDVGLRTEGEAPAVKKGELTLVGASDSPRQSIERGESKST